MQNGRVHIPARNPENPSRRFAVLVAVLAVACVLVVAGAIPALGQSAGQGLGDREAVEAFSEVQDATMTHVARSGKLEGATEVVDANGVVHGTAANGTSYVLVECRKAGAVGFEGATSVANAKGAAGAADAEHGASDADGDDRISFAAVGDVFATSMNFPILDAYAGNVGDGAYDFEPYYRAVRDELGSRDVRFVNQETPCAGEDDGYAYSGYPIFNTPDSSISALASVGFNVVNFNSNHSWDQGSYGIERTQSLFAQHPEIALIGSYASPEDRSAVRLVRVDGKTIAFLSYSYGDNNFGSDPSAFPNQHYTCQFDKAVMASEVERAKGVADAVVVYMHWGSEYDAQPNEQQLDYAQFLVDQDVDLVIGSHAHILQPVRTYTSASGKRVPVVFGLSDFITGWTITDTILSGAFTCDFVWNGEALEVTGCAFVPAIEWSDGGDVYVRFLKDMSADEINANTRTPDVGDDVAYLRTFLDDLHMDVPVQW